MSEIVNERGRGTSQKNPRAHGAYQRLKDASVLDLISEISQIIPNSEWKINPQIDRLDHLTQTR